ncbi:hypothetical protein ACOSQ4_000508 [Xanthoceras sorbifolium]
MLQNVIIAWEPPLRGWVKLNVDGSCISDTGQIAIGGVLRDCNKRWLNGYAAAKGHGNIVEAEIWAVLEGLNMAWIGGHKKVQINSDSKDAVDMIMGDCNANNPLLYVIQRCKELLSRDWNCMVINVYRESNYVADSLAKEGHCLGSDIVYFASPPPFVQQLYMRDVEGATTIRGGL